MHYISGWSLRRLQKIRLFTFFDSCRTCVQRVVFVAGWCFRSIFLSVGEICSLGLQWNALGLQLYVEQFLSGRNINFSYGEQLLASSA